MAVGLTILYWSRKHLRWRLLSPLPFSVEIEYSCTLQQLHEEKFKANLISRESINFLYRKFPPRRHRGWTMQQYLHHRKPENLIQHGPVKTRPLFSFPRRRHQQPSRGIPELGSQRGKSETRRCLNWARWTRPRSSPLNFVLYLAHQTIVRF